MRTSAAVAGVHRGCTRVMGAWQAINRAARKRYYPARTAPCTACALMQPGQGRRRSALPCTPTDLVVGGGDGLAAPWPADLRLHPIVTAAAARRHEAVGGRVGGAASATGHLLNHALPRQPAHQVDHQALSDAQAAASQGEERVAQNVELRGSCWASGRRRRRQGAAASLCFCICLPPGNQRAPST